MFRRISLDEITMESCGIDFSYRFRDGIERTLICPGRRIVIYFISKYTWNTYFIRGTEPASENTKVVCACRNLHGG